MKILRKGDEFRKMPERSIEEVLAIKNLIYLGWNYCAKQVYKDFYKTVEKSEKVEKSEAKKETKKETKSGESYNSGGGRKLKLKK